MDISPPDHHQIPDFAYQHRHIILGLVLTDSIMANLDGSMVNIALPAITTTFHAPLAEAQWVITAYLLVMTCLFIICGKISGYIGVCPLFIIGSLIFTLSSFACGLSADLNQLILSRIAQGIGSSMVAGISSVIIFLVFPSHEIGRALGYSGSIISVCAMFGPALGGLITDLWGWQYIFFINLPIGILLFFLNLKYLKIPEKRSECLDIDWKGAGTLISTILFIFLTCGEISASQHLTMLSGIYAVIAILSGIVFLVHESVCRDAFIHPSILKNRQFILAIVSGLIMSVANFLIITLFPFYFEGTMGLSSFEIGMILMITPVVQIFASSATGWIIDRYRWRYLVDFALLIVSATTFLMGHAIISINLLGILILMICRSIGASLFQGQNNIDAMTALPAEETTMASSIRATTSCLGASLGVSLASIIISFELSAAGYYGPILAAGQEILASSVGEAVILSGFLCLAGAVASTYLNHGERS